MARLSLVVALVGAADAFQAGASLNSRRSVVARSKMNMQVGEAVVAQPTALAKVQGCRDSDVPRARARARAAGHRATDAEAHSPRRRARAGRR